MKTLPTFRRYDPEQLLLLAPNMSRWLPTDHLVHFVWDAVEQMELSEIYKSYDGSQGGLLPYPSEMMVTLLIYAYCVGIPSSRQIENATYELVPLRVSTANQHPAMTRQRSFGVDI